MRADSQRDKTPDARAFTEECGRQREEQVANLGMPSLQTWGASKLWSFDLNMSSQRCACRSEQRH